MGRFGNVMLTGGETDLDLDAHAGEVVRFYFTNTANTRLFNVALPGARMKLVGGDSGRYEHETFVEEVLLAPSERAIVDVLFDTRRDGSDRAPHPDHTYTLGTVAVADDPSRASRSRAEFERSAPRRSSTAERARSTPHVERPPDKTLAFESLMPLLYGDPERHRRRHGRARCTPTSSRTRARHVPDLRDEAHPSAATDAELPAAEPRRMTSHDTRRRSRVGGPHARDQPRIRLART